MNQMREESVGSLVPSSIYWTSSTTAPPSSSSGPEGSSRAQISRRRGVAGGLVILILSLSADCMQQPGGHWDSDKETEAQGEAVNWPQGPAGC